MGKGGIHCWMCGVAELGDGNILYYTTPTMNYSSISKKKIPAVFWLCFIVLIFIQHFIAKLLFSTMPDTWLNFH